MSAGPDAIIDAGPVLTFLARKDTTRILYAGLGSAGLLAPEQVEREVIRKSRQESRRFGTVEATWKKIVDANRLTVLPDDETAELAAAVQRLCLMPMSERMRQQEDLGEMLVIAHAAVRAEAGTDIAVLIQERAGTAMAQNEARRINGLEAAGRLRVWNTQTILLRAAGSTHLPDRARMKTVYENMRSLDSALPPISETNLLTAAIWERTNAAQQ
ncbi:hypothetical protein [Phytoactinopolyspora mesophila]|uniref:DUF4935 domain-containing protein n=1 Tax=Phytoactinopolyspora mesophila TaxID=2650750 RepID=A0A7K3M010_9ACTN|nr:hypothetical protein [Phytoactinopolyspora mesophila]NDL56631.1 hypothetical protein [Phytoactinopolyspora mesophila]